MDDQPGIGEQALEATLRRLAGYRSAVIPLEQVGEILHLPREGALSTATALEAAGLLETWAESPDGPAVILSGLAATRLGFETGGDGPRGCARSRWGSRYGLGHHLEDRHRSPPLAGDGQTVDWADPSQHDPGEECASIESVSAAVERIPNRRTRAAAAEGLIRRILGLPRPVADPARVREAVSWVRRSQLAVCEACVVDGSTAPARMTGSRPWRRRSVAKRYVPSKNGLAGGRGQSDREGH